MNDYHLQSDEDDEECGTTLDLDSEGLFTWICAWCDGPFQCMDEPSVPCPVCGHLDWLEESDDE